MAEDNDMEEKEKRAKIDWRARCVEEFKLIEVPWPDEVAVGSQRTWRNYYEYRTKIEARGGKKSSNNESDDVYYGYDEEDGKQELIQEWDSELDEVADDILVVGGEKSEKTNPYWKYSLDIGNLVWEEDYEEIRTASFYCHVWSPYRIPQAIHLEHRYHRRPRYSTMEFHAIWGYKLVDFSEAPEERLAGFTKLCSNHFEDEKLRADVIDTANLSKGTVNKLRRFLLGSVDESKKAYCDDYSFLRLLFGSMGTFDYETLKEGWLGYEWSTRRKNKRLRKRMIEEGIIKEDEYPRISWLEHATRAAAGALRPVDMYYEAPTIEDAAGYDGRQESSRW